MKLELTYPVVPFYINQHFGSNHPCVKDFGLPTQDIITPITGPTGDTTCPVNYDKLYLHWGMKGHSGVDLMAGEQPIYSSHDGVVIEKQVVPARGLGIGVLTNETYTFPEGEHYIKLRYWHFKDFNVEVGDTVKRGDILGTSNNTGYSSGNHLHFEGVLIDKDAGGHPFTSFPDNGYFGAINIEPYILTGKFLFLYNLYFGIRSSDVMELQKRLGVIPTGFFGTLTFAAVRAYQSANNISSTGFVGPLTRASLNSTG